MPPTSCYFLVHVLWVVEKNQQVGHKNSSSRGWGGCAVSLALLLLPLWANNSALFKKYIYTTRHEIKG